MTLTELQYLVALAQERHFGRARADLRDAAGLEPGDQEAGG